MITIAVDPASSTCVAFAVLCDGVLSTSHHRFRSHYHEGRLLELRTALPELWASADEIVIEGQEIYTRGKVNPNDILKLAHAAGYVAGLAPNAATLCIVKPKTWNKSRTKAASKVRTEAYWDRKLAHPDEADAAGILKWWREEGRDYHDRMYRR